MDHGFECRRHENPWSIELRANFMANRLFEAFEVKKLGKNGQFRIFFGHVIKAAVVDQRECEICCHAVVTSVEPDKRVTIIKLCYWCYTDAHVSPFSLMG